MKLIKYKFPMYRSMDLAGAEIIDKDGESKIYNLIGKKVYFGEVAGKHSSIWITLAEDDVEVLTESRPSLSLFRMWFPEGYVGFSLLGMIEQTLEINREN